MSSNSGKNACGDFSVGLVQVPFLTMGRAEKVVLEAMQTSSGEEVIFQT